MLRGVQYMALPRVEDGHAKIANELAEAFAKVNLSAYESRVLWCILRKTYGWNKESDRISYSQFEEATGIDRRHLGRTIRLLTARCMVVCRGEGQQFEYAIQKDYEQWHDVGQADMKAAKPLPEEAIVDTGSTIAPLGNSEIGDNHCLIRAELLPNQGELLPKEATKPLPKEATTKARKHITKALDKSKGTRTFGEAQNVKLTPKEYEELVKRFGEQAANWWIDELSLAKAAKGYKSKSDYFTVLAWERREKKRKGGAGGVDKKPKQQRARGSIKVIDGSAENGPEDNEDMP